MLLVSLLLLLVISGMQEARVFGNDRQVPRQTAAQWLHKLQSSTIMSQIFFLLPASTRNASACVARLQKHI